MLSPRWRAHTRALLLLALVVVTPFLPSAPPADAQAVTSFPLPTANSAPNGIVDGPDGNMWFAEFFNQRIGRSNTAGSISEFMTPNGATPGFNCSQPKSITRGPDGALWYTDSCHMIARITTGGSITPFFTVGNAGSLGRIVTGPDGNLWFGEGNSSAPGNSNGRIARMTTSGSISYFNLPPTPFLGGIQDVTSGPDGNLWFTGHSATAATVGRITTSGAITLFPSPASASTFGIVVGPDNNLWFTDRGRHKVGVMNTAGTLLTEFDVSLDRPEWIVRGPDNALWYAANAFGGIGRITTTGAKTTFLLGGTSQPFIEGLAVGPDGNIWFTDSNNNRIGRLTPPGAATATPTRTPTAGPSPTFTPTLAATATATRTPVATATATPSCAPRPSVSVAVVPSTSNQLQVTITASGSGGNATNRLVALQFTRLTGAVVDVGALTNQASPFSFAAGGAQAQQFFVRRTQPGAAGTVELTVVDGCGSWPTFVGGGPAGWPPAPPPPPPTATPGPSAPPAAAAAPAALRQAPTVALGAGPAGMAPSGPVVPAAPYAPRSLVPPAASSLLAPAALNVMPGPRRPALPAGVAPLLPYPLWPLGEPMPPAGWGAPPALAGPAGPAPAIPALLPAALSEERTPSEAVLSADSAPDPKPAEAGLDAPEAP